MIEFLQAIFLGVVEGLTEFIPVSSTGHLILAGHLVNYTGEKANTFEIFIQFGAILAVVVLYRKRFLGLLTFKKTDNFSGLNGLWLIALTTLPGAILGILTYSLIKERLFNPITVAIGLLVGGIAILVVERFRPKATYFGLDSLTWRQAIIVGLFQCLALWPGMSRSSSTIIGGLLSRVERLTAAEFSFFAAVPLITAAAGYDLVKSLKFLQLSDLPIFATGFVVAFISAWFAVKFFIRLLGTTTLNPFAWYRIAVGLIILVLAFAGVITIS